MRTCIPFPSVLSITLVVASLMCNQPWANAASGLVGNVHAERNGLVRSWFSQAAVDRTRHRVQRALLEGDQVIVLSTAGVVHAMNAYTGSTDWVTRVGNPEYPSLGPAVSDKYVALINGSTATVLDRQTGLEVMSRELSGGAGGGPAIANDHIFVPMFTGKLESYSIDEPSETPWYYASTGRVFDAPVATATSVVWPTDRGYLYVANAGINGVRYRFESSGRLNGGPSLHDGRLFATSSNGYLYALDEQSGQQQWRYSSGSGISKSPIAIGDRVYVTTDAPSLDCVSIDTGDLVWTSPGISDIAGVSKARVYGMNRLGDLMVLDKQSGVPVGRIATSTSIAPIVNEQTDRLYLVSETGLVQCIHEIGSVEPYRHVEAEPADASAPDEKPAAEPTRDEQQPAERADEPANVNPFGAPAETTNPFGAPAEDTSPFGAPADTSNPFGDSNSNDAANDNPFDF